MKSDPVVRCSTCRQVLCIALPVRVRAIDNVTGRTHFFDSWECLADWALVKRIREKVMGRD